MDIRSNSRANTCIKILISQEKGTYLLDKKPMLQQCNLFGDSQ